MQRILLYSSWAQYLAFHLPRKRHASHGLQSSALAVAKVITNWAFARDLLQASRHSPLVLPTAAVSASTAAAMRSLQARLQGALPPYYWMMRLPLPLCNPAGSTSRDSGTCLLQMPLGSCCPKMISRATSRQGGQRDRIHGYITLNWELLIWKVKQTRQGGLAQAPDSPLLKGEPVKPCRAASTTRRYSPPMPLTRPQMLSAAAWYAQSSPMYDATNATYFSVLRESPTATASGGSTPVTTSLTRQTATKTEQNSSPVFWNTFMCFCRWFCESGAMLL
jgi:hypothetical protein